MANGQASSIRVLRKGYRPPQVFAQNPIDKARRGGLSEGAAQPDPLVNNGPWRRVQVKEFIYCHPENPQALLIEPFPLLAGSPLNQVVDFSEPSQYSHDQTLDKPAVTCCQRGSGQVVPDQPQVGSLGQNTEKDSNSSGSGVWFTQKPRPPEAGLHLRTGRRSSGGGFRVEPG